MSVLECWNLNFQTEAIFADNFAVFADNFAIFADNFAILADNFPKFADYFDIEAKLSANMASVWICGVQHSGVSAGLVDVWFKEKLEQII